MATKHGALHAQNLIGCHHCTTVQPAANERCSFCHHRLHGRKLQSLQRTWIFMFTALLLYVPANLLPIMTTSEIGHKNFNTIAGGVVLLWEHGSYLVATIIFIASLLVPPAKFIALIWLCLCEQFKLYSRPQSKMSIYRAAEFVGRWSMLDVFVVAFLASLIQMGSLMSIYPGPAALAFGGMVIFTMLAANSLEPKLFWDDHD
jgi:paraquat-inducible protein A